MIKSYYPTMRLFQITGLLFFVCSTSVLVSAQSPAAIDSLLQKYYVANQPGAAVVISKNDRVIFSKGYGVSRLPAGKKIDENTIFNIGSITKQFTAYCILQLAEQKKLSLNDTLSRFLPQLKGKKTGGITIRQLLTHSSGIADHYQFTDTNKVKHATDKDVLDAVATADSFYFKAGSHYRYSNTAYCLLALVIEKITGSSYRDYLTAQVFTKLGMRSTTVLQAGKAVPNAAKGYAINANGDAAELDAEESIFFTTEGDGGVYTSAMDYLKWWRFLQSPAQQRIIKQQRSAQFSIDPVNQLSYGYGWFVSARDQDSAVYHSGSNGGFRAFVFTIPSQQYIVAIFSNQDGKDLEKLVQEINALLRVSNNSFTKISALVSFTHTWPIFAPCKEIR